MAVFKLGKMTFGSLFKEPETVQYPFVEKPKPAGLKGHIAIDVDNCILCGMCEKSCTTNCITVSKPDAYWEINRYQCVQCGYCTTVCPKKCLSMAPDYAPAATQIAPDRFEVPASPNADKKPAVDPRPDASEPAASKPEPTEAAAPHADEQLETLLGLMGESKSAKVRAALES